MQGEEKLDNPVWYSLSEKHQQFSINYKSAKFYHPDYCPFGGVAGASDVSDYIDDYSKIAAGFFIVGEKPALSKKLVLNKELVCLQMIMNVLPAVELTATIVQLTEEHRDLLFGLVNLVQPGYFKPKTALLGTYFGIFKGQELVAVAGERMKMNGFTEISAIVTHPNHTGNGYAKQLICQVAGEIFRQNCVPFLHVVENNLTAIGLYEKLGFETRRKISFWNITQ